jgi:hypothetical protein
MNRGDQEQVSREELHKLIKTYQPIGYKLDCEYLQVIINKYRLSENASAIKWLANMECKSELNNFMDYVAKTGSNFFMIRKKNWLNIEQ